MPSLERRKWPRVALEREIVVYTGGQRLSCQAVDISAGGVCLLPPAQGDPGLLLRLNISFRGGHTVAVDGVVVREGKVGSRYAWGVRFHRVVPRIQQQLAELVQAESQRQDGATAVPVRRVSTGSGHPRVPSGARGSRARGGEGEGESRPASAGEAELDLSEVPGPGEYQRIGGGSRERIGGGSRERIGGGSRERIGGGSREGIGGGPRTSSSHRPPAVPQAPPRPGRGSSPGSESGPGSRWEISLMDQADDPPDEEPTQPRTPTPPPARSVAPSRPAPRAPHRPMPPLAGPRSHTGPALPAVLQEALRSKAMQPPSRTDPPRGMRPVTGPGHPGVEVPRAPRRTGPHPAQAARQATSDEDTRALEKQDLENAIGRELDSLFHAALDAIDEPDKGASPEASPTSRGRKRGG